MEVTSKITGRQKDHARPLLARSHSLSEPVLWEKPGRFGSSPAERPMWMSPTPSQQGPEAHQQLLETVWKQTLHPPVKAGSLPHFPWH